MAQALLERGEVVKSPQAPTVPAPVRVAREDRDGRSRYRATKMSALRTN